jgi:uncharacterized protein (TIGR02284 family)
MENTKTIELLNKLVRINNDRIEGYETAIKETFEEDLKTMFSRSVQTSHKCKNELVDEIIKLGGTPDEGHHAPGRFFGVWADMKVALAEQDRKTIFDSCEFGEDMTIGTYGKVLDDASHLSIGLHNMIQMQYGLIKIEKGRLELMRNALPASSLILFSQIFGSHGKAQLKYSFQ